MKKAFKNLLQGGNILGKFIAAFTVFALVFTVLAPNTLARFWRADYPNPFASEIPSPGVFLFGYGYGHNGWGWGYGYGYNSEYGEDGRLYGYYTGEQAYEDPTPVDVIGAGEATVEGGDPTNTTKVTMTETVSFNIGPVEVVLPQGLEITKAGGGSFDATSLQANYGTTMGTDISGEAVLTGAIDFGVGTGDAKLIFSVPVQIRIPTPGAPNGTNVQLTAKHHGEGFTTYSLTTDPNATCDANGNATPNIATATVVNGAVTIYTCAASQFATYTTGAVAGTPAGTPVVATGGGGCGSRCSWKVGLDDGKETTTIGDFAGEITANFQDIADHWAQSYINQIAELGIVSGKTSTRYAPNDNITRAELTKIAMKAFGYSIPPTVSSTTFPDVSTSAWYAPYVVAARNAGIVQGIDGYFRPNQSITRVDALKILIEAAGFTVSAPSVKFPDTSLTQWYAKYVSFAKKAGIISGYLDGTFGPGNPITRAEVAKIIVKMLDMQ